MNADERYARVRVRRQLLPLIESFNPRVVEGLVRTAELLRQDMAVLDLAAGRLVELAGEDNNRTLRIDLVAMTPPAIRCRALRRWIEEGRGDLRRIDRVHILAVERLLFGDKGGRVVELPGGARVARIRGLLRFS